MVCGELCAFQWCLCVLCRCAVVRSARMNVGTAHSEVNPNTRVMNSRGMWLSYVLGIGLLHIILLSIPFVSVPVVWTLTNLIHNMVGVAEWHVDCLDESSRSDMAAQWRFEVSMWHSWFLEGLSQPTVKFRLPLMWSKGAFCQSCVFFPYSERKWMGTAESQCFVHCIEKDHLFFVFVARAGLEIYMEMYVGE